MKIELKIQMLLAYLFAYSACTVLAHLPRLIKIYNQLVIEWNRSNVYILHKCVNYYCEVTIYMYIQIMSNLTGGTIIFKKKKNWRYYYFQKKNKHWRYY